VPSASLRCKWIALSNTTLGMLMATVNASIMLIALPDIFRGIGVNPLQPGNTTLLLWLIMGYLVVTAVLVVSFGRLGDMFGRVRMFNLGFALFAFFSVMLSLTWLHGTAAAWWLIGMRILQGVGGAMLMANSSAILTDAFPSNERGLALGLNQVAASRGRSSAWSSAACSARSTGGTSSWSRSRSGLSGRSGPTSSCRSGAFASPPSLTGGAT
jgi:MFS family permease